MPETAAVYWESKIRIYGFKEKTALTYVSLVVSALKMEFWGQMLEGLAEEGVFFEFALMRRRDEETMHFCLVLAEEPDSLNLMRIREAQKKDPTASLTLDFPVEMISFHGPHFQDRHGIAQAAVETLETGNMPIHAMGCAGTSICIVVPEGGAKTVVQLLSDSFVVPRADDRKKPFKSSRK